MKHLSKESQKILNDLSFACIGAESRIYAFHDKPYDYDESGDGWRIASFEPARDRWAEVACWVDSKTLPCGTVVEAPIDRDGSIGVTWGDRVEDKGARSPATEWFENAYQPELGETTWFEPGEDEYPELCGVLGIPDAPEDEEDEDEDLQPMMNYLYPLDGHPGNDWPDLVVSTTVVEVDGEYFLALTGGGMDMTWAIVASYVNLGYAPPVALCDLPSMAGRGSSERDRMLVEASKMACEARIAQIQRQIERIEWAGEKGSAA